MPILVEAANTQITLKSQRDLRAMNALNAALVILPTFSSSKRIWQAKAVHKNKTPITAKTPLHSKNRNSTTAIRGAANTPTDAAESWIEIDLPHSFSS